MIIVWDVATKSLYAQLTLHKGKVEALSFSPNDKYLVSLGGEDDNTVIVWDLAKKSAICGSPASKESSGLTRCITYSQTSDTQFFTGGNATLRSWEVDAAARKVRLADRYSLSGNIGEANGLRARPDQTRCGMHCCGQE